MIDLVVDELKDQKGQPLFRKRNIEEIGEKKEMIEYYQRYCEFIQKGINNDITKSLNEGKSVIIEGYGLDTSLLLDNKNETRCEGSCMSFTQNMEEYINRDDYQQINLQTINRSNVKKDQLYFK